MAMAMAMAMALVMAVVKPSFPFVGSSQAPKILWPACLQHPTEAGHPFVSSKTWHKILFND